MPIRSQILAASRTIGVEPQLRALQRALENRSERQNRRDDEHLAIVLATILRPDSNCVDVGANVGAITDRVCKLAPRGHHIAIEPLPELAVRLEQRHPEIDVHCCALSDTAAPSTFVREVDAPTRSGFRRQNGGDSPTVEFPVEVRRLDDIVPADTGVDFIKIDVEGAEGEVLRGAPDHRTVPPGHRLRARGQRGEELTGTPLPPRFTGCSLLRVGLAIFDFMGMGTGRSRRPSSTWSPSPTPPPGSRWNFPLARPN